MNSFYSEVGYNIKIMLRMGKEITFRLLCGRHSLCCLTRVPCWSMFHTRSLLKNVSPTFPVAVCITHVPRWRVYHTHSMLKCVSHTFPVAVCITRVPCRSVYHLPRWKKWNPKSLNHLIKVKTQPENPRSYNTDLGFILKLLLMPPKIEVKGKVNDSH